MTAPEAKSSRRIVIEPVTRVEGHGKVTIYLDEQDRVTQTRLHIVEFRGFERFIQGRPYWEVPVLVQRLCGICPVSHHLAASKAIDRLVGADVLPPTAEKMRRLMHFGQFYQSHSLHFFHLASPDLLFGFEAPAAERNVLEVAARHPELARQAVLMRKFGQELIRATAGKRVHGIGTVAGGVNKNLSVAERDLFLAEIDQQLAWSKAAVGIARGYTLEHIDELKDFGSFDSNHLSIVGSDGAFEIYDGNLRAIDAKGSTIFDNVDCQQYAELLVEEVRSWSYMKFPYIRSLGPQRGWYRVGPLARLNTCERFDTPLAEACRKEFKDLTGGPPVNVTMGYHWARMIETLHCVEKIRELLDDPDLQGTDLKTQGQRRDEAIGVIEAPRGTLFHHYRINDQDQVVMANLIVSTTSNNEAMNRSVARVAEKYLSGSEITEGLLNRVEVAIRAYDPCLSCATHALGQMPLQVTLVGAEGEVIATSTRDPASEG